MQSRASRKECVKIRLFILALVVVANGCVDLGSSAGRLLDNRHYVLEKKDASILDGPYKMKAVLSPTSILVEKGRQSSVVMLRGCLPVQQEECDARAIKILGTMWPEDVYLRKDSTVSAAGGGVLSIVYDPANQVFTGEDEGGKRSCDVLTYTMPQLLMLTYGYCRLDHCDTNYPLYSVFVEAEDVARRHRKGIWAHR